MPFQATSGVAQTLWVIAGQEMKNVGGQEKPQKVVKIPWAISLP
jgi:hypothetical protein